MKPGLGARNAIESFVAEHLPYLLGLARLLTEREGEAEDLVQETLVCVVKRWRRVSVASNQRAYLRKMMINAQINGARRKRLKAADSAIDVQLLCVTDGGFDRATDREIVNAALKELSATQRAAIVLHFYYGLTAQEIGTELGLQPSSVRASVSRGLERLRQQGLAHTSGGNT